MIFRIADGDVVDCAPSGESDLAEITQLRITFEEDVLPLGSTSAYKTSTDGSDMDAPLAASPSMVVLGSTNRLHNGAEYGGAGDV